MLNMMHRSEQSDGFFPPLFFPIPPCEKAWALVSGKYVEAFPDPAKWKTNFRCALKSTRRFELVSESKDPDPHHVYRIRPLIPTVANPPADTGKDSGAIDLRFVEILCVLSRNKTQDWRERTFCSEGAGGKSRI